MGNGGFDPDLLRAIYKWDGQYDIKAMGTPGFVVDPSRQHRVFDFEHWSTRFPPESTTTFSTNVDKPKDLITVEHLRKAAAAVGDLGPSVPVDAFVWALSPPEDKPWLTKIGGLPWRPAGSPWPMDENGRPLAFLGQICFIDSLDVLGRRPPSDVALIFAQDDRWEGMANFSVSEDIGFESRIEWHPIEIERPMRAADAPATGLLEFEYHGIIHRTVQYTDWEHYEPVFERAAIGGDSAFYVANFEGTSIGRYAGIPQGWPFEEGDGCELLATLGSVRFQGLGPLCDARARWAGSEDSSERSSLALSSDNGCIYLFRDDQGEHHVRDAGS
ncbi:MAG: DUF1963 domain-containing protein [Planctomycetota bacterium]